MALSRQAESRSLTSLEKQVAVHQEPSEIRDPENPFLRGVLSSQKALGQAIFDFLRTFLEVRQSLCMKAVSGLPQASPLPI